MAAKGYSAGTIFLQVSPVFRRFQEDVEAYTKDIDRALGEQMEKSGEKAGKRAGEAASKSFNSEMEKELKKGVSDMEKALGGLNTRNLSKKLRDEVKGMRAELAGLGDLDLHVDDNLDKVLARAKAVRAQIENMRTRSKVFFDTEGLPEVYRKIKGVEKTVGKIDGTIKLDVDTKPVEREIGAFEKRFKKTIRKAASHLTDSMGEEAKKLKAELKYLENLRVGIDISGNQARRELNEIMRDLARLEAADPEIDAKVNFGKSWAELHAWEADMRRIDGTDIDVDVKVNTRDAQRGLFGVARSGDDAANSFRSFNIWILAVASAGPSLIPVLGGIAGGLLALGPAAAVGAAGLGSVLVGFSGLGDALDALQSKQEQAATTAQTQAKAQQSASYAISDAVRGVEDAERSAARAAEDAAERVADAREQAAETVERALERQREAQESYRDSVDSVREAEQALRDAREGAKDTGEDIDRAMRSNKLAIDQGMLDAFNATVDYNATQTDGSATNAEQEQARINMERARLRLEELRSEQAELAEQKKKWDKEGVNGTEEVQSAQDALNDALERQKEAYEGVRDAAKEVDEARRDGAKMVADAIEAQNETLADNARAIEDARRGLARARAAQDDLNNSITSQQQAVDNAMDALGPAGRKFVRYLAGLKKEFFEFRDDIQAAMLPSVQVAMEGFFGSSNAKVARDAMVELARAFGTFTKALSTSLQGPTWGGFFEMLAEYGPQIMDAYGGAFIAFMEAMASIMTVLAPYALDFAEGLEGMMQAFANWAASKEGTEAITNFMDWVQKIGPDVLDFLGAFIGAAVNIAVALAPWGDLVLRVLTGFLEVIEDMDPKTLGGLLTALIVVLTASQTAYAFMNLIMAGAALLTSPVGIVIFAVVALAGVIGALWTQNKGFRDFMKKAWGEISAVVSDAWKEYLKPALGRLWDAFQRLWDEVLQPFFAWLGPILLRFAKWYLPLLLRWWSILADGIAWAIEKVVIPVVKALAYGMKFWWEKVIAPAANWIWKKVLKPAFEGIAEANGDMMEGMRKVWRNVLKPVWDYITDVALPHLKKGFQGTIDDIKDAWDGLKKAVGAPVRFVIDKVLNQGLIKGFNKVAGWVNRDGIDPIEIPNWAQSYATGGVMPGYTPGRDVHAFVSPTAGRLELSGGEAVMRPEWTAAVGADYVYRMNQLAANGGVNAVRDAVYGRGGYWMGGILPLPGASVSSHGNSYGYPAFDLNYPGYADYGAAIKAFKEGIVAQMNYIGDASYGRWAVLNHPGGQNSLYAHLSRFADIAVGQRVAAGQYIGNVGDLGNTGTPPTSHLHFEIRGGSVDYSDTATGGGRGGGGRSIPQWLSGIVSDPLGAVKNWITSPWGDADSDVTSSPAWPLVKRVPLLAAEKVTDKVWDVVPGWVKTAAGWAGDAADWAVGGVESALDAAGDVARGVGGGIKSGVESAADFLGLAEGGILPYNGTMMYDDGGYLPPGLTTVVNLTGKPEPVFTDDQWANVEGGGGSLHYEPHFEGSDLTAEDVAADLNFTFRRIRRSGKYAGVGEQ